MTFIINVGKWGGIYWHRGFVTRLCLGWVAFSFLPIDIDKLWGMQEWTYTKTHT